MDDGDSKGGHSPRNSANSPLGGALHNFLLTLMKRCAICTLQAERASRFAIEVTDFIFFG